jgi:hypothetical protein
MPAHRSFSVGGSIARRRSPGRNCRRACCAAADSRILTPRSRRPATNLNAKQQRRGDARTITLEKFSMTDSQWIFSRNGGEFTEKKGKMIAFSAPSAPPREMRAISIYSTLFPNYRHPPRTTQPIAPKPLAVRTPASTLANLINFETLFLIFPGFYERQPPLPCPSNPHAASVNPLKHYPRLAQTQTPSPPPPSSDALV